MMTDRGHTVYHYGHARSEVVCTKHISVIDDTILEKAYGAQNWHANSFQHNTSDEAHVHFNKEAIKAVGLHKEPGDFLLMFWGSGHADTGHAHASDMIVVEPGIGSHNALVAPFCVFESYAVMHHVYGKFDKSPRFFDAVVPNYFDPDDFIDASGLRDCTIRNIELFIDKKKDIAHPNSVPLDLAHKIVLSQQPYVLVLARLIPMKGIQLAIEACQKANIKLLIAGQGSLKDCVNDDLKFTQGPALAPFSEAQVTHLGYVEPRERAILLAGAKCLLAPTLYSEPFCGVNVEAQMSGVPVVTTDWGAFSETVLHGVTGYRCRTIEQFVWALHNVDNLFRPRIKAWSSNYSLTKIATMYEEYFSMLLSLPGGQGFYAEKPGRLGLRWLEKTFP
jgi:glycosyltransferase involved in cell wall biosynthesis